MNNNDIQNSSKKSSASQDIITQVGRLGRMMAVLTAGSLFVSPNEAHAAPSQDGHKLTSLMQAHPDLSRKEVRQMRRDLRQENRAARIPIPSMTPGFVPNPILNFQEPRNNGNDAARAQQRLEKRTDRLSAQVTQNNNGSLVKLDNGANLDMTSSERNITLGDKLFGHATSATITVGGETKTVSAGDKVTAAEYIALKQSLGGDQSIVVDSSGKATGGQVDLNSIAATKNTMKADSLTVAQGVTAVGDLDRNSSFKLDGDLTNFGSVYAVNSGNSHKGADITADNITNASGALISSNAGSQFGNKTDSIDLSLTSNNFSNLGTVESSGNLTITASNVTNSGTVSAAKDLTLDSPMALSVDNNGGTMSAGQAINVRPSNYNGTFNTALVGGDFLSNEFNLNTGRGTIDVDVNQLTGKVNGAGHSAHVTANTDNLYLGDICLKGDPTFFNLGTITLGGTISANEAIAIIAETSIVAAAGSDIVIDAENGTGGGSNIFLIAGFDVTTASALNSPTIPTGAPGPITAGQTVTIDNGGSLGGNIDLLNANSVLISSAADVFTNENGANVTMLARAVGAGTGSILLPTNSVVESYGFGTGTNGNINISAGSSAAGTTIQLGTITANGGNNSVGGNIIVSTRQPSAGAGVTFNDLGQITAGTLTFGGTNVSPGIIIGAGNEFIASGANLTIAAGTGGITINSANGGLFTNSGTVNLTTTGTLNANFFAINAFVGASDFNFTGNTGVTLLSPSSISTAGGDFNVTSNNGNVVLDIGQVLGTAGGDVSISAAGDVTITASAMGGGQIITFGPGNSGNVLVEADSNNNGAGDLLAGTIGIVTSPFDFSFTAGNISLDSGDNVGEVLQIGSLVSFGGVNSGTVAIGTLSGDAGDVTVFGTIDADGGIVTIDADTNDHNVVVDGIFANSLNIDVDTATVTLNFGTVRTDTYNVVASQVIAPGTLTIQPETVGTSIGVAGGAGTLNISTAEFNQFVAQTLAIGGNSSIAGTITVGAPLDVSSRFNLEFSSGGLQFGGNALTLGDKSLIVSSSGSVNMGNINGGAGQVFIGGFSPLNITTGVITTTSGEVFVAGDNVILGGVNVTTGDANIFGDNITITGNSSGTTGDFVLTSANDISVGQIILTGAGADIFLKSFSGDITTTGDLVADPINMIAAGNINIGGSLTANNGILVLAGQNITSTASFDIDASDALADGGAVTFVAGADFTDLGIPNDIIINGASGSGGSIDLTGGGGLGTLTTEALSGSAGDVTFAAFTNGAAGGRVLLPTSSQSITTGGIDSGEFTIVAGANSGQGIQTGTITTTAMFAGNTGTGNVTLVTSAPIGGATISQPSGVVNGSFLGGTLQGGSILTGNITARAANVTAQGGSNVGLGAVDVSGRDFLTENGGSLLVEATGTDTLDIGFGVGSNYITSFNGNAGALGGDGGSLQVTNHGSTGIRVAPISIVVTDGDGGTIDLDAEDGNIQLNAGTFAVDGAGAAGDAGAITLNGSGVTAVGGNVVLRSNNTGIGTIGGAVKITTSGATNLNLGTGAGQIQIITGGLGSSVDLQIGGTINQTSTGSLNATIINLVTNLPGSDVILNGTNNGNFLFINSADAITIGALANPLVALNATAGGNITTVGGGLVQTATAALTSTGGNIGNNQFARFNINTSSLTANAFSGSVFLNDANDINIIGSSTAANTFDLQAGGAISQTAGGTIGANDVVLRSTGSTITLTQAVTGGQSVSLRSSGALTNTLAGIVSAPSIALRSDNSTVGSAPGSRFEIDSDFVTATANGLTGSVFIHDANSVDIGPGPSSATLIFDVLAGGNITNSGTITAADVVLNTGGAFNISNLIIGSNSISLTSVGSITNGNLAGTLIAPQINLTTAGNIGSSALSRFTIDAGSLTLTAAGNVFVFDANQVNIGPTASSAGGTFDILAGSDITTNGTIASTNLVLRSLGGFIDLGANASGTASANLRADGDVTTSSGAVLTTLTATLTSDNGDIGTSAASRFVLDASNLVANAPNGSVYVQDGNTLTIGPGASAAANAFDVRSTGTLTVGGSVAASDIALTSDTGAVNITSALSGSSLSITSAADITGTSTGGTLVFDDITLVSTGGSVGVPLNAVTIDTTNLSVTANGGVLINEIDDVTIVAIASAGVGANFSITAGTDITVQANVISGSNTTLAAGDNINLGANVTGPGAVLIDAGNLATITDDVTLGLGSSVTVLAFSVVGDPGADLNMSGSSLVTVSSGITLDGSFNAGSLSVGGQINVQSIAATGDVTMVAALGLVGANGDISGNNVTITSGTFTTQGDITAGNDVTIRTSVLNNTNAITANNDVNITSFTLGALTVDGSAAPGGSLNALNGVVNIDSDQDVTFAGEQTFNGTTNIDPAVNFSVIVNNGANITGNDTVNLNTCSLILNGNGTISGNPLNFNCPNGAGTIANSSGNVDLSGVGLVYNGQSLAIIASGSVIGGSATTINLTGTGVDGGDLLVVAGFDFTPATGGQVNNSPVIYTFTGSASASGGNVDLQGVTLTTNGTAGFDAGNITLVAAAGNTAAGTVKTGAITADATGGGDGGDILVIAQGGFTIGPVSNTGAAAGLINLNAATPLIVGGEIRVQNGEQAGPGQFVAGAPQAAGTIANSNGDVDLTGLSLTFTGLDLAIIASGDVLAGTTTSINLNNMNGDAGDLLVVAGFDFTPPTVGQVNFDNGTVFTFGGESATGGDILFGGLNISTASTLNGNGGQVTLVANGAAGGADGMIIAGNIDTSSFDGFGGDVKVIAEGGFALGTINTAGALGNGAQNLAAAAPVILGGPVTVQNGIQGGAGDFTFIAPTGNGTIANSLGSVNLTTNLTFVGLNLAIIAANDINAGTANLIDLSNPGGTAGTLTLIAGYDFAPATAGQVTDNSTLFTIGAPNALGGNINFGGLNIVATGTNGGDVLAIANGGTGSTGSITIGNVDASGTTNGGSVFMIGEGGITVGDVTTAGASGGGGIAFQVAQPTITGGAVTVQNGNLGGTGVFVPGAAGTGAVSTGTLDSGNDVLIRANAAGGTTVANSINAVNGVIISNTAGDVTVNAAVASTNGAIDIDSSGAVTVGSTLNAGSDVLVTGDGAVGITGTVTSDTGDIDIDSTTGAVTTGALLSAASDVFVTGNGAVAVNGGAVATAGVVDIDSTTSTITAAALTAGTDVLVTANGAVSLTALATATAGDVDIESTTAGITTAALTAGSDVFLTGAGIGTFNGAVIATAGLIDIDTSSVTANALTAGTNILIDGLGGAATFNGAVNAGNDILVDGISGFTNATAATFTAGNDITVDVDAGNLTVNGAMVSGGDLSLNINDGVGTAQALAINANLTANTGIFIGNLGMDKNLDTSVIAANVVVTTTAKTAGQGDVTIQIGAPDTRVVRSYGSRFDIVEIGGTVSLFGRKAKGLKPVNTLTAQGANLTITVNRDLRNDSLFFNGGVQVTADPPVAAGTPTYVNGQLVGGESNNSGTQFMTDALALNMPVSLTNAIGTGNLSTNNLSAMTGLTNGLATLNAVNSQAVSSVQTRNAMLYGAVNSFGDDNSYMVSSQAPSVLTEASICSDSELGIAPGASINRTAHGEKVSVKNGQVLFVPFQDTVVETQHGTVNIDANSTVLVSVHGDKLAVYNLDDNHKGAVSVTAKGSKMTLAPGSHLTVATDNGDFGQINSIESISHRNVGSHDLQGARVHTSEFSVASAIMSVKPLQAVMTSNHPQAKKTASKLIKTTAVLMHLNGSEYHHYFKTAMTAMAK
ncbi:MAG: hypothetical protein K2X93_24175 [Candidatus Obscuribacterales bacterium]|nr:hypothetical protein [Candidatus Obscuribacterales bacterium]